MLTGDTFSSPAWFLLAACLLGGCAPDPAAEPSDRALDGVDVPVWLSMRPNYRVEESTRLAVEAMQACAERFPLDTLRARLDSLRRVHGIEPARTRSHPEAARQLDVLLERQAARGRCVTSSPEYVRSIEIAGEAPDEFRLAVHTAPDSSSPRMGTIRIHMFEDADDPRGPEVIELSYRPNEEGAEEVEWLSDRRSIGGYGGYYHTVTERRGDWLRLPVDPFPAPGWIDWRAAFHSAPRMESVFDDVYTMRPVEAEVAGSDGLLSWDTPGVVFLRSEGDRIWFRLEEPADGPCRDPTSGPEAPVADAAAEFSLGLSELVDERGHLDIEVKYWKGC